MYPTLAVNIPDDRQHFSLLYFRLHWQYIHQFHNIKNGVPPITLTGKRDTVQNLFILIFLNAAVCCTRTNGQTRGVKRFEELLLFSKCRTQKSTCKSPSYVCIRSTWRKYSDKFKASQYTGCWRQTWIMYELTESIKHRL